MSLVKTLSLWGPFYFVSVKPPFYRLVRLRHVQGRLLRLIQLSEELFRQFRQSTQTVDLVLLLGATFKDKPNPTVQTPTLFPLEHVLSQSDVINRRVNNQYNVYSIFTKTTFHLSECTINTSESVNDTFIPHKIGKIHRIRDINWCTDVSDFLKLTKD